MEKLYGSFFNLLGCHCAFEVTSHVRQNLKLSHLLVVIKVDSLVDFVEFAPNDVVNLCGIPSLIKRQHLIEVSVHLVKGHLSVIVVQPWMSIALADVSRSANFVLISKVHEIIEVFFDRLLVHSVAIMLFFFDFAVRVVVTMSKLLIDINLVRS